MSSAWGRTRFRNRRVRGRKKQIEDPLFGINGHKSDVLFENNDKNQYFNGGDKNSATSHKIVATPPRHQQSSRREKIRG